MARKTTRHPLRALFAVLFATLCLATGCGSESTDDPGPLVPAPEVAAEDKGPAILDGCRSGVEHTDAWACVYGNPGSETTVVLWGDSHAMQYSPALIRLAEDRDWRLVTMFRGNCLIADVAYKPACDSWRRNAAARIADEEPDLVVVATDTGDGYALWQDGTRLTRDASEPILREAFGSTLSSLRRSAGNRPGSVIVLRDLPRSEFRPPDCLVEHPDDPAACDFQGFRKNPPGFDLAAARGTPGARLIDLSEVVCPNGICNSARDGMVIYRDTTHISATYAKSLAGILGERLGLP